jgi:glycosyltransferase involved in cell wall biosynthesis
MKRIRLLLIGHLSEKVSGSSISFKYLVENLLSDDRVELQVVNTRRPLRFTSNPLVNLAVAVRVTTNILLSAYRQDVITFHASRSAMLTYGPIIFGLTRLFRKPLVLHLFGGTFEENYTTLSVISKFIVDHTILRAELFLLQTKKLVGFFEDIGRDVKWYSTSRKMQEIPSSFKCSTDKCSHYVFLGRIIKEKGVDIILDSVQYYKDLKITIDIFGSLEGDYTTQYFEAKGKGIVHYKGILPADQVHEVLLNYDALILPTFYEGEGYPGVIIEAYGAGLPVITTKWKSIPEIVDTKSGILIPPKSSKALAQAINNLYVDDELYRRLKEGAIEKREKFSDHYWTNKFVQWCMELMHSAG